ncbi:MAG: hypothetical protein KatS3mg110_2360 [Pirellulaceae bacterium]|nr:MAG: hypothetical protein KatS3mg110_2360 [Pirellulaceae bacterium]
MRWTLGTDWDLDIERGPEWLIVHVASLHPLYPADQELRLAQKLFEICERHLTWRIVVDIQRLPLLTSYLIGQLVLLEKRLRERGGVLRLSGLSDEQVAMLRLNRLDSRLACYDTPQDAILGWIRSKPR